MGQSDTQNLAKFKALVEPPTNKERDRVITTKHRLKKFGFIWLLFGIITAIAGCPTIMQQNAKIEQIQLVLDSIRFKQISENGTLTDKPIPNKIVFEKP